MTKRTTTNRGKHGQLRHMTVEWSQYRFCACVPVPVRLLCGRLPHRAPLVLPARPRADKNNLATLPHHTRTLRGGEFTPPFGRMTESRPLLPKWRQRASTRQHNGSCTSRSTHIVVDMRSTVQWLPTARTSACTSSLPLTCVSLPLPCLNDTPNEPSKCY